MDTRPYFAYGSNLCTQQMRQRCPGARVLGRACLRDHVLVFPRFSRVRRGGVASVVPQAGAVVEGVLYALEPADLMALDGFEGTGAGHYTRGTLTVQDARGGAVEAWVYLAVPMGAAPHLPARDYLETILRGAVEHGLPEAYCAAIRGIRTRD